MFYKLFCKYNIYITKNRDRMLKLNSGNFKWKPLKERKNQPIKQEKKLGEYGVPEPREKKREQ